MEDGDEIKVYKHEMEQGFWYNNVACPSCQGLFPVRTFPQVLILGKEGQRRQYRLDGYLYIPDTNDFVLLKYDNKAVIKMQEVIDDLLGD